MSQFGDPVVRVQRVRLDDASSAVNEVLAAVGPKGYCPTDILLKPNLIKESHAFSAEHRHVITQRVVTESVYAWVRQNFSSATVRIADAPQGDANMELVLEASGIGDLARKTPGGLPVADLRTERYAEVNGVPLERYTLAGDPLGSVRVNLGTLSCFFNHRGRYYGADYDIAETNAHHRGSVQEYMFSGTALASDLIVNLPKLKTHKKAGITASLKNLVGLNTNKNWLPHHTLGTPRAGGDAYPDSSIRQRLEARLLTTLKPVARRNRFVSDVLRRGKKTGVKVFGSTQDVVRSGNWYGNDTIWRMILDLNRILLYANTDGSLAAVPRRQTLSIVDAIVAGEGNGPEAPDPVEMGLVIGGSNFLAVDLVCARLMGFDWTRIPHLAHGFDSHDLPLTDFAYSDIEVVSNVKEWNRSLASFGRADMYSFKPAMGWRGHIEASL